MKLIGIIIEEYLSLFKQQIIRLSDEFLIDYTWDDKFLIVKRNQDYLSDFYGKSIYNFSPIVGINGTGKSTILDFILRHNSNTKAAIDNVKMVSIYTDDEKIFIDSISMEISNEKDFEKYNNRQNIKIKNCSTKKIREGSGGSYGGGAIAYYEYDADHFPNYFLTFDELRKSKVIHSKNMLVQLSALLYRFEEKFPEHANESLIDKIFINHLFNIFDTEKLPYNAETSDRLKSGDITYYDFLAQWKSDVESIEDYNIFISNFMEFIDLVHALEKDDIVQIKENVILISYNSSLRDRCESFYLQYKKLNRSARDLLIYTECFHNSEIFMSIGETNLISVLSYINEAFGEPDFSNWVMVIDEIESGLHLEWSRQLVKFLVDWVNKKTDETIKEGRNYPTFQFIFTTHSPFMLSDIKPGNVVALKKNMETGLSEVQPNQNTFAKNIQEIMHDDLFIQEIYGEFALKKINQIIDQLQSEDEMLTKEPADLLKEINFISEPLLREKLIEMYNEKFPDGCTKFQNINVNQIKEYFESLTQEEQEKFLEATQLRREMFK
ncbi:TPA: AAA family ATPase [Streptococcus suis]|uniref:AAA family ATPase n=1 Tax=Streptococcus suis TaxID=1307 RepID=UPI002AAE0E12|nr:AAA family ATPase [Streptococcus suis]HEM6212531.1 AAA family ATPase [Streptococcus suis]